MKSVVRLLTVLLLCLSFMCTLYPAALAEGNGEDCEVILTQNWGDFGAALSELVREGMDEVHAAGYGGRYETARLIVKMRGELPDLSRFAPKTILRDPENHYLIQFASPQEAEDCADFLAALDDVIYVEPDSIVSISDSDESADAESAADVTPDPDEAKTVQTETAAEEPDAAAQEPDISADMPDTETTQSDGEGEAYPEPLDEADALAENDNSVYSTAKSWGVAAIHADEYAADLVSRGKTGFISVAVVDSGVDLSHPMLSGRLLDGYDFVESDAIPQDEHSHGTHVSGTIVDSTPGLNVYILPVRVLNAEGKGTSSTIALGVRYAADNGASVINLSLGGEHNSYKEEAIEYAMQKGIAVVAAAGNDGVNIGTDCPAHIAGCITVASVNQSLNRSSFSNYGSTVDIAAPGENIYSSVLNGSYGYKDGTSMAAPYVSAAAAMLMCDNPGANVASLLCGAATDLGAAGWDSYYGAGLLNLESFVQSGPKHYTVTYNANGGSGAPASQRKTAGEALTLANGRPLRLDSSISRTVKLNACGGSVSNSTLTASAKIRYAFQGWNTMEDGSGTDYAPRASYSADESVTLFAQWTESYYDVEALELPTAAREGYTFLGWADSPDADGGVTGSYFPETDTQLYAIWGKTGALSDSVSWTLFDNGKLLLTGSGKMPNFSFPDYAPWYAHREQIKQVVILEGVTSIGDYAFVGCSGLTSVTIPDSVTSIGSSAFYGCSGLQSVNISDLTCWLQISFAYYSSNPLLHAHRLYLNGKEVTSLIIPEGTTSIGKYAFQGCSGLTSVTIPDSVTSIGDDAFSGCSGLTSVTIPAGVTSIGDDAFSGCSGLTSVTIPDSVTSIGDYAFSNCSGLTSVTIPEGVTSIGDYAFYNCSGLTSVTIPDSVTSIGDDAFSGCSGLTSVTIPAGVTSIGDYAFSNCSGLTSVTIPDGVTSIGSSAFRNCSGLTSIRFSGNMPSISSDAFYSVSAAAYYFAEDSTYTADNMLNYGGTLTWTPDYSHCYTVSFNANGGTGAPGTQYKTPGQELSLSSTVPAYAGYEFLGWATSPSAESVVYQPGDSYSQDADITLYAVWKVGFLASGTCGETLNWTLDPLGTLTISGTDRMSDYSYRESDNSSAPWYAYRSGIKQLAISEGVTSIGSSAFYECSKLTSVTIPESVTSIGIAAFSDCSGLTSVTIPEGVTSIGDYAFDNCSGLTSVTIPAGVTSIGGSAFFGCSGLTSVTIPNSVTSIPYSAFSFCSGLTSVTIPEGVTSIGGSAFYGCSGLTSVTIPNSVTSIGDYAFYKCSGLQSVNISSLTSWLQISFADYYTNPLYYAHRLYLNGKEVTSLIIPEGTTRIGNYAFYGCSGLTSVTIPDGVTSIGSSAFRNCSGLTSVTIPDSVTYIGDYAFCGCSKLKSVTIPESVTFIDSSAFYGCSRLKDIYFTGNKPYIASTAFGNVSATAYYPEGATGYDQPGSFGGTLTWQSYVLYRIVYNAVGGTAARTSDPVAAGNSLTLPTAQREGYAFLGWAESADAISARYLAGETFTPAESMTLYAVWQWDNPQPDALLPAGLRELEDEALAGTPFHVVRLPEGMTHIGSRVFDGCPALLAVYVPASVTDIAADAFEGAPDAVVIVGSADSAAQRFAATHGITFQLG